MGFSLLLQTIYILMTLHSHFHIQKDNKHLPTYSLKRTSSIAENHSLIHMEEDVGGGQ